MWELLTLSLIFVTVNGHSSKIQNEGDLQTELMPQELNPEFVAGKELEPWKAIMPLTRLRRDVSLEPATNYGDMLKRYSRVAACVVLAISAVVEIGLYVFESYSIG